MSRSSFAKLTTAIRIGVVILAAGITIATVLYMASMPPPPPESDGFAHGMAAIIGGGIILISLGLAILTIITPTLLGRGDPMGFTHRQRLGLKAAGGLVGLGVIIAIVTGLNGVVVLLALLGLAFSVVCAILIWRFGESLVERRVKNQSSK